MKLQLTHFLIFLGVAYIIVTFIIFIFLIFSKKFYISSREDLVKFIELKDSVINNLKSEINSKDQIIRNLEFERNSLSELLEKGNIL